MSVERQNGNAGQMPSNMPPRGEEQKAVSILALNNMLYTAVPKTAVAIKRTMVKHYFDANEYLSGANVKTAKCTINSGDSYIDPKTSYLTFKINLENTGKTASFASGSALNVINRLTLTSHSGTEVERLEDVNNLMRDVDRYNCSQEWINHYGGVMGYYDESSDVAELKSEAKLNDVNFGVYKDGAYLANYSTLGGVSTNINIPRPEVEIKQDSTLQYCIPLSHMSGLFKNSSTLLMGMGLMSGMRFELQLETRDVALKWSATPAGAEQYKLSDIAVVLDSYQLADDVLRVLTEQQARAGAEVSFTTWDLNKTQFGGTVLNIEAKRAVSRALHAFAKFRVAGPDKSLEDSFNSEQFKVVESQWKQGGLFFPNAPITTNYEHYQNAQYVFRKVSDCVNPNSVSIPKFLSNNGLLAVSLLRSPLLAQSGIPNSGSRQLQLRARMSDAVANREVSVYLGYMVALRVFLDRVVVKN